MRTNHGGVFIPRRVFEDATYYTGCQLSDKEPGTVESQGVTGEPDMCQSHTVLGLEKRKCVIAGGSHYVIYKES